MAGYRFEHIAKGSRIATVKGKPETVIERGQPQLLTLACLHITEHDLKEDLRLQTGSDEFEEVERAHRTKAA